MIVDLAQGSGGKGDVACPKQPGIAALRADLFCGVKDGLARGVDFTLWPSGFSD